MQGLGAACTTWVALFLTRLGLGIAEGPIFPAGGKLNGIWMTKNDRGSRPVHALEHCHRLFTQLPV